MKILTPVSAVAAVALGASALLTQSTCLHAQTVARVYLSHLTNPNSAPAQYAIVGYNVDSTGQLTPIAGGPWSGIADATTGGWLFATDTNGQYVTSYQVDSTGALHETEKYDVANRAPANCSPMEYYGSFALDHTGATLYANGEFAISGGGDSGCYNNSITDSFKINKDTGALTYLGIVNNQAPLTFSSSNVYAYGATSGDVITAFQRQSNGALVVGPSTPAKPDGASGTWDARFSAADGNNHLAVILEPPSTSPVLASYTIQSNGDLTTTNTVSQMPQVGNYVFSMQMSWSGQVLAVADSNGLHVYHFNGANPITPYATLIPSSTDTISDVYWDSSNHLYAIGNKSLYVFTVTPTSYSQAPGSPYSTTFPVSVIVHSM